MKRWAIRFIKDWQHYGLRNAVHLRIQYRRLRGRYGCPRQKSQQYLRAEGIIWDGVDKSVGDNLRAIADEMELPGKIRPNG